MAGYDFELHILLIQVLITSVSYLSVTLPLNILMGVQIVVITTYMYMIIAITINMAIRTDLNSHNNFEDFKSYNFNSPNDNERCGHNACDLQKRI